MSIAQFFKTKKILIVDDCRLIFTATRIMLVKHGCQVDNIIQAVDAKSCIEICETQQFDFVVCDYNLGKGPDGLQLLEILYQKQLIPEKTVIFIVTAESKKTVFYGFSEYEPDGYLIKPIKMNKIADQIVNAFALKQSLLKIDETYREKGKEKALIQALSYPQKNVIRLKQAEILVSAKDYQRAKDIYLALIKEGDHKAKLGLAALLIERSQHEVALQFIESLIMIPEIKIQAIQLKANCYLFNGKIDKALEAFNEARELSPQNIVRLFAMFNICEILENNALRMDIASKISLYAINSHWDSFVTLSYRLRALLRLPYCDLQQRTTQTLIFQEQKRIEKQYASLENKLQRQVIRAQVQVSKGDIKGCYITLAKLELNEQQQGVQPSYIKGIVFELDMVFLYTTLGKFSSALLRIEKLQSIAMKNSMLPITQRYLFEHLKQQTIKKKEDQIRLMQQVQQSNSTSQCLKISVHLLDAWLVQPFSMALAESLLKALTKAIPMGISIKKLKDTLRQIRQTLEVKAGDNNLDSWATLSIKQIEHTFFKLQQQRK